MLTTADFYPSLRRDFEHIKVERMITSAQSSRISIADGCEVINLYANNYLGLSSHPAVMEAEHAAFDRRHLGST